MVSKSQEGFGVSLLKTLRLLICPFCLPPCSNQWHGRTEQHLKQWLVRYSGMHSWKLAGDFVIASCKAVSHCSKQAEYPSYDYAFRLFMISKGSSHSIAEMLVGIAAACKGS